MTQATFSYLDPATFSGIDSLELRARMIVEGLMTGMHRSPNQGFSVEFAQHRQYAPGDDLRHLDWKVFGRTDKLYLKQYQKETNVDLVVLVDVSGSMAYTSVGDRWPNKHWCKFDHAATTASVLAYLAIQQQDRVGLTLFDHRVCGTVGLSNMHGHWQSIVEVLSSSSPKPDTSVGTPADRVNRGTDIEHVFEQVLVKLTRRSLIVLISDLFDDPVALERGLSRVGFRKHDLIILQTLDPAELTFPFRTPSYFVGLEGEGGVGLDPAALKKAYLAALGEHLHAVERLTRRFGFDHVLMDTSQTLRESLNRFLAYRVAAARKGK